MISNLGFPPPGAIMPINCERCGSTHGLHGDCLPQEQFKFNALHVSHLALKVDGHCEHLFVAILNGEAVGQVIALKQPWGACGLRMLFVTPKHRHKGIGSRLVSRVRVFAHNEGCDAVEIAVHKGNSGARKFWIHKRFIDMEEERQLGKDCIFMERAI